MVRGARLARPIKESDLSQSGELIRQNERETQTLRREQHAHR